MTCSGNSSLREKTKGNAADEFNELAAEQQDELINQDLERLGIAAIGMFNRRALQIASSDLNVDIEFFQMDDAESEVPGRVLTPAEKLLGSFFFVHQAQGGTQKGTGVPSSFEFLHNTFGEYLTADFVLRRVLDEVEDVLDESTANRRKRKSRLDQRLEQATAFAPDWYACLAHTPLHSRPVVLEMLREWARHQIEARDLTEDDIVTGIDRIVENQLERILNNVTPPAMFSKERPNPFPRFPMIGHFAIYSLNLVVLKTVLVNRPHSLSLGQVESHEDGTSPWEELTYLWRSWFSLNNLAGLTNVFVTTVEDKTHVLQQQEKFTGTIPGSKREQVRSVAKVLADDTTKALAGACFGEDDSKDVRATLLATNRAELKTELDVLVQTIEKNGASVARELLQEGIELFMNSDSSEVVPKAIPGSRSRLWF